MAVLTIRLPDKRHSRLKALAAHKKISVNELFEELSAQVLAEFDSEYRSSRFGEKRDSSLVSRQSESDCVDPLSLGDRCTNRMTIRELLKYAFAH